MINAEALIIRYLNQHRVDGLEAFADIPRPRPQRFITVERTGGGRDRFRDLPQVAVQVWAGSRLEASRLAGRVATQLQQMVSEPGVARVTINSVVSFTDPESGQARYQIWLDAITKHD